MNLPHIQMKQTLPQVGIHTTPSKMHIQRPENVIEVEQHPADVQIDFYYPEISTDWSQVYDDIGLKSNATRIREYIADMRRTGNEAIGQIARDGDRVGNIAAGEERVFGNLAKERFFREHEVETNVDMVPKHMPEFHVETRPPDISIEWRSPQVKDTGDRLHIRYQPSQIDIYLAVPPSIDITV